jgi:hypothetical protein
MNLSFLETLPVGIIFFCVTIYMLVFCELGFQFGARARKNRDEEATSSLGPLVGGLMGMLAFVLAMTFSMAASQHNLRKQNVLDDANAIGMAYLRADLLDAQVASDMKRLLREYVDIRLQAVNGGDMKAILARTVEIQKLLWAEVLAVARTSPSTNTSLNIQAINGLIEMHKKRVNAGFHDRIPSTIWYALFAISALSMMTLGTQVGLTGKRRLEAVIPMLMAFAVLVTLVEDLNNPQTGLIKVGQYAMLDLQRSMHQDIQ